MGKLVTGKTRMKTFARRVKPVASRDSSGSLTKSTKGNLTNLVDSPSKPKNYAVPLSILLLIGVVLVFSHFFTSTTGYVPASIDGIFGGSVYNLTVVVEIPVLAWAGFRGNLTDALINNKNTTGGNVYELDLQKSVDCNGFATVLTTRANLLSLKNLTNGNNTQADEMLNMSIDYPESAFHTFTLSGNFMISTYAFNDTLMTYTNNHDGTIIYPTYLLRDDVSGELVFATRANLTKGSNLAEYQLLVPANRSNIYNFFVVYNCEPDPTPSPTPSPNPGPGGGGFVTNNTNNTNVTPQVTIQINNTPNMPNELPLNVTDDQAKIEIDLQIERAEKYLELARNQSIDVSAEMELIEQTKWLKSNKLYFEAYRNASRAVLQLEQKLNAQKPTHPLLLGVLLILIALILFYLNRSKAFLAKIPLRDKLIQLAAYHKVQIEIVEIELKQKRVLIAIAHANNPFALKDLENAVLNTNHAISIDVRYARTLIENHETVQKENMQTKPPTSK